MKLNIVEIGPGRGGLALSIINYFYTFAYDLFKQIHYNAVQISGVLAQQLRELSSQELPKDMGGRFQIHEGSIFDYDFKRLNTKQRKDESMNQELVFVIGMEILDNLPHDLLTGKYDRKTGSFQAKSQARVEIKNQEEGEYELVNQAIQDILCKQVGALLENTPESDEMLEAQKFQKSGGISGRMVTLLNKLPNVFSNTQRKAQKSQIFVPSCAIALIHHLKDMVPNHRLILADFDSFRYPLRGRVAGRNAPIVTDKETEPTKWRSYPTFLVKQGEADICFPTDFYFLRHAYNQICKRTGSRRAKVVKHGDFMKENLEEDWGRAINGYCPLIEEYLNASFFLS